MGIIVSSIYFVTNNAMNGIATAIIFLILFFVILPTITHVSIFDDKADVVETLPYEKFHDTIRPGEEKTIIKNETVPANVTGFYLDPPVIKMYLYNNVSYVYVKTDAYQYCNLSVYDGENETSLLFNNVTQNITINESEYPWLFEKGKTIYLRYKLTIPKCYDVNDTLVSMNVNDKPANFLFNQTNSTTPKMNDVNIIIVFLPWVPGILIGVYWLYYRPKIIKQNLIEDIEKRLKALEEKTQKKEQKERTKARSIYGDVPDTFGDYRLATMTTADKSLETVKQYREAGHWTKIVNYANPNISNFDQKKCCAVYVSQWTKEETETKGIPRWKVKDNEKKDGAKTNTNE